MTHRSLKRSNVAYSTWICQFRQVAEVVECHLTFDDLRPAYQVLKKRCSMSTSQVSAFRTADGCLVLGSRWIAQNCRTLDADPPINDTAFSFDDIYLAIVCDSEGTLQEMVERHEMTEN